MQKTTFFKPGRPRKCTVQIMDATDYKKAKHLAKYTVYANPEKVREVVELALINWENETI